MSKYQTRRKALIRVLVFGVVVSGISTGLLAFKEHLKEREKQSNRPSGYLYEIGREIKITFGVIKRDMHKAASEAPKKIWKEDVTILKEDLNTLKNWATSFVYGIAYAIYIITGFDVKTLILYGIISSIICCGFYYAVSVDHDGIISDLEFWVPVVLISISWMLAVIIGARMVTVLSNFTMTYIFEFPGADFQESNYLLIKSNIYTYSGRLAIPYFFPKLIITYIGSYLILVYFMVYLPKYFRYIINKIKGESFPGQPNKNPD
jgi:hypothetical protein